MSSLYDQVPARYHLRRRLDEASLRRTQVIPVTPERLDAVYPEIRCRPPVVSSVPAEIIADTIDAAAIRTGMADTQETPAVHDSKATAEAMMRRARNLGPNPREALRRMLDAEMTKAARRFDAAVGIGLGPVGGR
jgi:hypothetical protein